MKRIVLYPYSRRLSALADYIDLGGEYEIGGLAADRRSGLAGHGSRYGENAEGTYPVTDDLEAALAGSEVLALFEPEGEDEAYDVKGTAQKALRMGRDVVCCFYAEERARRELEAYAEEHGASVRFLYESFIEDAVYTQGQYMFSGVYVPQAKVVFAAGLLKGLDQQRVSLGLAKRAAERGYRAAVIGSGKWLPLIGYHDIGGLMEGNRVYGEETVRLLNSLIRKIDTEEKPDMLIVEIPGELMKFNEMVCGDFGVGMYKISQAVKAEEIVCSLPYGEYTEGFYNSVSEYAEKKYDRGIGYFQISNRVFLYNESMEVRKSVTFAADAGKATETAEKQAGQVMRYGIFNAFHPAQSKAAYDKIIDRFENM